MELEIVDADEIEDNRNQDSQYDPAHDLLLTMIVGAHLRTHVGRMLPLFVPGNKWRDFANLPLRVNNRASVRN